MKKDFNDAIMKLEDFCKTYNALSMEDKLLFAVLGPNGSDVAATVANEINEPKDPHGGLTDEEFSKYSHFGGNDYENTDSTHYNPVCCAHCDGFDCPFEESEDEEPETYSEDDLGPGCVDIIHRIIEGLSTEHLSTLECAACMLTPDSWIITKESILAKYDPEGDIFDVFIDGEHYFEKLQDRVPKDDLV